MGDAELRPDPPRITQPLPWPRHMPESGRPNLNLSVCPAALPFVLQLLDDLLDALCVIEGLSLYHLI